MIKSGRSRLRFKIGRFKAQCGLGSRFLEISGAEADEFGRKPGIHELFRGSWSSTPCGPVIGSRFNRFLKFIFRT